jgi:hypothetical protein
MNWSKPAASRWSTGTRGPDMAVTIRNGVITVTEKKKETRIDLEWLKNSMRTAIRPVANRRSAYAEKTREWVRDLDRSGIRAIPRLRQELKLFFGAREKGAAQCFKNWDYWMSMIWMAAPKKRATVKPDMYARNFEKAFKGDAPVAPTTPT